MLLKKSFPIFFSLSAKPYESENFHKNARMATKFKYVCKRHHKVYIPFKKIVLTYDRFGKLNIS